MHEIQLNGLTIWRDYHYKDRIPEKLGQLILDLDRRSIIVIALHDVPSSETDQYLRFNIETSEE